MELAYPLNNMRWSPWIGIGLLLIFYSIGIAGILLPIHPDFILLTPANLLVSLLIVLAFHRPWTRSFLYFLLLCYAIGFAAEWLGVQTGLLFGSYAYGHVLGPKAGGTPLIIGINWILLTYSSAMLVQALGSGRRPWWLRALLSTLLMVGLDVLIEPVAVQQGFWSWAGGEIPLHNYLGWTAVAFPLQLAYHKKVEAQTNYVAAALFILQFIFFLVIGLFG